MARKISRRSIGAVRSPEAHKSILAAAAEILAESGYAGFTIEAVARRAGASKPTIYRWWKGKAALIMELYENERETALSVSDRGSLERELTIRMRNLWRLWQKTPLGHALRSIIAEAQIDPSALAQLREDFLPKRRASTHTLFARAIARGEISPQADIEMANNLIYSFNWFHLLTDQLEDESVIEKYVAIIVQGLKSRENQAILDTRGSALLLGERPDGAQPRAEPRSRNRITKSAGR
jgi:AcrR family transcriptional regulator